MAKVSKKDVNYRKGFLLWQCQNCSMFVPPHTCTLVKGVIHKTDVCSKWEAKWLKSSASG